jgi:diacylglycerol kinase (ATP)
MSMSDDIPVIVNPAARGARAANRLGQVRALSPRLRICETRAAGDARQIARDLALAGAPLIVAAGGDGDLAACWQRIEAGRIREIDLWQLGTASFMQLAGAGLDAAIIQATTWQEKKKWGPLSYVFAGLRILRGEAPRLTVYAPGRKPIEGVLVLMGNGERYGGPFRLFRDARLDDGLLDVLVFHEGGYSAIFNFFRTALFGASPHGWSLSHFQTTEIEITGTHIATEVDGEIVGTAPVSCRRAEHRLRVIV